MILLEIGAEMDQALKGPSGKKTSDDGRPPERLGTYRLETLLGRGGMGEVYLAWDERLERHVALKRILPEPPPDERTQARFHREARAVARLSHPAIVQIFELLDTEEGACLVMEYVEGQSLVECIAAGELALDASLRLAQEIAEGLAEAHGKGLIHRDLKPENVRVTPSGHAKILDFGLARLLWKEGDEGKAPASAITQSGALVGTVHAMSPEQASGRPVDHRSDLFALGGLLYEMLTGQAPFRGTNVLDTLRRVTSEDPTPLAELRSGLPPELVHLVESLLAKDPAQRPQNARLVVQGLERLRTAIDLRALESGSPTPKARSTPDPGTAEAHLMDLPTGEFPVPEVSNATLEPVVRTLLVTDLVDSAEWVKTLGDVGAAEVRARHDRVARDLLARHEGLEIDNADGFLLLFARSLSAVAYALAYQRRLVDLSNELGVELVARVGIHLGEVVLRRNLPEDISRGARPIEVEGLARSLATRVKTLASARQTLLTHSVFDLTRRAAADEARWGEDLRWLAHGAYLLEGVEEPVEIFEVGVAQFAPLLPPADSETARRAVSLSDELVLGWRPAPEQAIPRRPHWVLTERLGAGGFGEVWLAAHKSGEQRVFKFCFEASRLRALKREVTLFRLLKEALGHRDDIARILDWNFDTAPYFLEVEHTEGGDLVTWVKDQGGLAQVPLATRLDLIAQIAEALAAAHSVGVLHKDVKPENVLIAPDTASRPRIRLTDFGIGLLLDRDQLAAQGVTAMGWTATLAEDDSTAGTRRYLAPELLEGKAATVQADVFSLGVLLYQLVVGDFARALASGWQRDVADEFLREDIAWLVDGVPERRPRDVYEVALRLRGLEERREERAAEQRRVEEAEEARRALARAQQRRRLASWVAAVIFAVLLVVLYMADRERRAHREVEAARQQTLERQQQAEGLIRFMLGDLREKLEPIGRLEILDDVGNQALSYFEAVSQDDLSADELASYAKALHQIGEVAHRKGDLDAALRAFEQALEMSRALTRVDPAREDWQKNLGEAFFWVGFISWRRGQLDTALEKFEAYLAIAQDLVGRNPEDSSLQLELIYAHSNIASVLEKKGDLEGALKRYLTGLAIGEVMVAREPGNRDFLLELAITHNAIGKVQTDHRRLSEAIVHHQKEVEIKRALVEGDPENHDLLRRLTTGYNYLGRVLDLSGAEAQALGTLESADRINAEMVASDPMNLSSQYALAQNRGLMGRVRQRQGDLESARRLSTEAVRSLETLVMAEPTDTLWQSGLVTLYIQLGLIHQFMGQHTEAAAAANQALAIVEEFLQKDSDNQAFLAARGQCQTLLGEVEAGRGNLREAEEAWERALGDFESLARNSIDRDLVEAWAWALVGLGRGGEANSLLEEWAASGYQVEHPADLKARYAM